MHHLENISTLKKILSHFYDIKLEQISSAENSSLEVFLSRGRIKLAAPNAVYSYEDLYTSFRSAFTALKIENRKINNVLVLGFGLGSIPILIDKFYIKEVNYTGIEIDESIISLAYKYNPILNNIKNKVLKADAIDYVKNCNEKFDLIAVDLFIDNKVPEKFETHEFCQGLKTMLAPSGLLLFSQLSSTAESEQHAKKFINEIFKSVFPDSDFIQTTGNLIVHNQNKV